VQDVRVGRGHITFSACSITGPRTIHVICGADPQSPDFIRLL
jgi:hypothetical protein